MKNLRRFMGVIVISLIITPMNVSTTDIQSEAYASMDNSLNVSTKKIQSMRSLPTRSTRWTVSRSRDYVKIVHFKHGWGPAEFECTNKIVSQESRWNYKANNPYSTAYGLYQILKTPEHFGVKKQTERYVQYIKSRYKTPCNAWKFKKIHGWY